MMKRFTSLLNRRGSSADSAHANGDSPEANAARGVRLFCESGGPNNSGEEVLHLPIIVESAESSPTAAREAANVIRKFLSKENFQRAYVQYNAIMLVRILADNPGKSFTRNLDTKFAATTKELLRDGRDTSVQQILRETLDTFEAQKPNDETLKPLMAMWQSEKAKLAKKGGFAALTPRPLNAPPFNPNNNSQQQQNYFSRNHSTSRGLPAPQELAARIEEAKTSGKLLQQVIQTTPPNEVLGNDLIKEFSDRCQSASRSIQGYINSDNPPPDDDTLLTLIETNDQLASALSKHQRAILQARRFLTPVNGPIPFLFNGSSSPPIPPPRNGVSPSSFAPPLAAPLGRQENNRDPFEDPNTGPAQGYPPNLSPLSPLPNGISATSGPLPSLPQEDSFSSQSSAYHPGYRPTQSYVNRQESSGNNYTMHGGSGDVEDDDLPSPEETRRPIQYRF